MSATMTRPAAGSRAEPHRRRRRWIAVFAVILVVAPAVGWFAIHRTPTSQSPPAGAAPASSTRPSAPGNAEPDVTWQQFAGLALPTSRADGPRCQQDARATCFGHDGRGAAFAAVHLLVRTFPFAGFTVFGPTIRDQVIGPHRAALARLTDDAYRQTAAAAGVKNGAPIPSEGGWVAGYRLDQPADPAADRQVRVLIRQAGEGGASGFTEYTVDLTWLDGDWQLIAPRWGDWRSAARAMSDADPDQYTSYDEQGRP